MMGPNLLLGKGTQTPGAALKPFVKCLPKHAADQPTQAGTFALHLTTTITRRTHRPISTTVVVFIPVVALRDTGCSIPVAAGQGSSLLHNFSSSGRFSLWKTEWCWASCLGCGLRVLPSQLPDQYPHFKHRLDNSSTAAVLMAESRRNCLQVTGQAISHL